MLEAPPREGHILSVNTCQALQPGGGFPPCCPAESSKLNRYGLITFLAKVNFDFLCTRFVHDSDLTWHILPPFLFLFFIFNNRAKFCTSRTRVVN